MLTAVSLLRMQPAIYRTGGSCHCNCHQYSPSSAAAEETTEDTTMAVSTYIANVVCMSNCVVCMSDYSEWCVDCYCSPKLVHVLLHKERERAI